MLIGNSLKQMHRQWIFLVSSNLERLVWYMSGKDGDKVKEYMEKLKADGIYEVDDETFACIQDQFKAGYLNEEEVLKNN